MMLPEINDQFWFDQSKVLMVSARDARNAAAQKLQVFAGWAWTVFVAGSGFTLASTGVHVGIFASLLLIGTSVFLMAAYWYATWAQMPRLLKFDPRVPDEIRKVIEDDLEIHTKRLKYALAVSSASAILVCLSVIMMVASRLQVSTDASKGLSAAIQTNGSKTSLSISGTFATEKPVSVFLSVFQQRKDVINRFFPLEPLDGKIQTALSIDQTITADDEVTLRVEWSDRNGTHYIATPKIEIILKPASN